MLLNIFAIVVMVSLAEAQGEETTPNQQDAESLPGKHMTMWYCFGWVAEFNISRVFIKLLEFYPLKCLSGNTGEGKFCCNQNTRLYDAPAYFHDLLGRGNSRTYHVNFRFSWYTHCVCFYWSLPGIFKDIILLFVS